MPCVCVYIESLSCCCFHFLESWFDISTTTNHFIYFSLNWIGQQFREQHETAHKMAQLILCSFFWGKLNFVNVDKNELFVVVVVALFFVSKKIII